MLISSFSKVNRALASPTIVLRRYGEGEVHSSGDAVVQWIALLPHSKKDLGPNPVQTPKPFCVEFAPCPRGCLPVLRFAPAIKISWASREGKITGCWCERVKQR